MNTALTRLLVLTSCLTVLGAGCIHGDTTPHVNSTLPTVAIPADFPTDILRFPGAQTYAVTMQNNVPIIGQISNSSTQDIILWLNRNYPAAKKDLHLFNDQGLVKLYSFQDTDYRYNVRLETEADSSTTRIVTQRVPITQGDSLD